MVHVGLRCRDECGNFVVTVTCRRAAAANQTPLRVSVREVVSALQGGRGPAQSHPQVLLPRLAGLEALRAHAQVRTQRSANTHHFFQRFASLCCRVGRPSRSSTLHTQHFNQVEPITPPPSPTPSLIISVSADLIKRLMAFLCCRPAADFLYGGSS